MAAKQPPKNVKVLAIWRLLYLFVATLPFSMYCYAQACRTMKEEDWINAHIAMYEFFGGVTRILTPDNLKVGSKCSIVSTS